MGGRMIAEGARCRMCARPIAPGARAHLRCQEQTESVNDWPDGSRQLACLGCERPFRSDSKAQRLCPGCRAGGGPSAR